MMKTLFKSLVVSSFCLLTVHLIAQDYQLTDAQKAQVLQSKAPTSKLGLGLAELAQNPIQDEDFLMKNGKIKFIAMAMTNAQELKSQLTQLGAQECVVLNDQVCGYISPDLIDQLTNLSALKVMVPEYKPGLNVGVVDTEGDRSMLTDRIRNTLGFDGSGVKIGILSNSYDALGGAAASVAAGDLPGPGNPNGFTQPVQVLKDLNLTGDGPIDEGRAMAEIIHDVAPGAELFFIQHLTGYLTLLQGFVN